MYQGAHFFALNKTTKKSRSTIISHKNFDIFILYYFFLVLLSKNSILFFPCPRRFQTWMMAVFSLVLILCVCVCKIYVKSNNNINVHSHRTHSAKKKSLLGPKNYYDCLPSDKKQGIKKICLVMQWSLLCTFFFLLFFIKKNKIIMKKR